MTSQNKNSWLSALGSIGVFVACAAHGQESSSQFTLQCTKQVAESNAPNISVGTSSTFTVTVDLSTNQYFNFPDNSWQQLDSVDNDNICLSRLSSSAVHSAECISRSTGQYVSFLTQKGYSNIRWTGQCNKVAYRAPPARKF